MLTSSGCSKSQDPYNIYSDFREEIAWNLAIACLVNNEGSKAIHILDQIIEESNRETTCVLSEELKKKITILGM